MANRDRRRDLAAQLHFNLGTTEALSGHREEGEAVGRRARLPPSPNFLPPLPDALIEFRPELSVTDSNLACLWRSLALSNFSLRPFFSRPTPSPPL